MTDELASRAVVKPRARRRSRLYSLFVTAFIAATIFISYANPGVLQSLRNIVFDGYQRLFPAPQASDSPVRIVAIDEESLARLGQWPWPRSTMAELTDSLGRDGARAIAFDIMFPEPDRTSPEQMLSWMAPGQAAQIRGVVSGWATHDGVFAQAIARNPTVLAATLQGEEHAGDFPLKAGQALAGDNPAPFLFGFSGFSGNLPALTEAARGIGSINWVPDRDQVIRRVPLLFHQGETIAPSLVLETLRVAEDQSTYMVRSSNAHGANAFGEHAGVNQVRLGAHIIPTDAHSAIWIRFHRSERADYISAWRVLAGQVDRSDIEGKIVLVGASAPGLMDLRATPLDSDIPGMEVHQQALEQILANRLLTRPDFASALELLLAIAAVLFMGVFAPRLSASACAVLGVGFVAAFFGASLWAYLGGVLLDPVLPAGAAFLFSGASGFYIYRQAEQQRADIRRAFSQYLAPSVVRQLAAHPEKLTLGGEVRDLTLLFCDVRNFTGISEGMSAEQLTAFINSLLTPLTDIIIENGGTVDKYMGDAIMSFWNAPLDDAEHARHGVDAALAIVAKMVDLNTQWQASAVAEGRTFAPVSIGIGINSGECCVGNLGSVRRFDYSAIGDNVNITSRLEGLTKTYGLALVVGEETVRRVSDMTFLEVDLVRVKGHAAPSRIFTPLVLVASDSAQGLEVRSRFGAFLTAYRAGAWPDAHALLRNIREFNIAALERMLDVYASRVDALSSNTPADWDGVYVYDEK